MGVPYACFHHSGLTGAAADEVDYGYLGWSVSDNRSRHEGSLPRDGIGEDHHCHRTGTKRGPHDEPIDRIRSEMI